MWAERVLQGKRRLAALLEAEEHAPRRWRALPLARAWGRSGGQPGVSLSWCRSSSASPGGTDHPFPKKLASEQQDGSRSQRRLPACGALASLQDCAACPACAASARLGPCRSGAGLGTGSCAALVSRPASSAAPRGALEGCTGSQRNVNDFLMRFSMSPLMPAVREQRLQSREGIFLSSRGKCSRVSCSLFVPPGPVSPQPPGSGKVHGDLLSRACQMHPRGCC